MHKIVLYCKSYRNDIERIFRLCESIKKFNFDNIPVYISVPSNDMHLFNDIENVNLIEDELVYTGNKPGWVQQQIVKSSFCTWCHFKCFKKFHKVVVFLSLAIACCIISIVKSFIFGKLKSPLEL